MNALKEIIKNSNKYSDFILLNKPASFKELFNDEKFDCVQLHSTQIVSYDNDTKDIIGFCGAFSWIDNVVKSLDGDSYNDNFIVVGYKKFESQDGDKCIDVLVGDDW